MDTKELNPKSLETFVRSVKELFIKEKSLEKERLKRGDKFNIFQVMGMESDEVNTHSAVLANMLDPRGSIAALNNSSFDGFYRQNILRSENLLHIVFFMVDNLLCFTKSLQSYCFFREYARVLSENRTKSAFFLYPMSNFRHH